MSNEEKNKEKELPWRQIIIETNGNEIKIPKNEVAGSFELRGILQAILDNLEVKK